MERVNDVPINDVILCDETAVKSFAAQFVEIAGDTLTDIASETDGKTKAYPSDKEIQEWAESYAKDMLKEFTEAVLEEIKQTEIIRTFVARSTK